MNVKKKTKLNSMDMRINLDREMILDVNERTLKEK